MKSGYYWVKMYAESFWEPALFVSRGDRANPEAHREEGWWYAIGKSEDDDFIPAVVGDYIEPPEHTAAIIPLHHSEPTEESATKLATRYREALEEILVIHREHTPIFNNCSNAVMMGQIAEKALK